LRDDRRLPRNAHIQMIHGNQHYENIEFHIHRGAVEVRTPQALDVRPSAGNMVVLKGVDW
jgi:hypothetical protein